jgi:polar amino acid transport system substrate-binding protein
MRVRGDFCVRSCSLLLAALFFVACDRAPGGTGSGHSGLLDRIVERGEMRVGYLVWPPAVTRDESTQQLGGIFPDMVQQVAEALQVRVVWQEVTLANFAAALNTGQVDFSVGPTFVTIPRAAAVSFTTPVAYVGNAAVVRTASNFRPSTLEQVDRRGMRVAVLQGQAIEELVRRALDSAEVVVLAGGNLTAPLAAVAAGQADIGFMNSVTVAG